MPFTVELVPDTENVFLTDFGSVTEWPTLTSLAFEANPSVGRSGWLEVFVSDWHKLTGWFMTCCWPLLLLTHRQLDKSNWFQRLPSTYRTPCLQAGGRIPTYLLAHWSALWKPCLSKGNLSCRLLFSQMKVSYVLCLCKGIILYLIKYLLIVSVTLLSSGTSLLKCVKKFCHTRYSAVLVPYGQGQLSVDCVTQLFNILCNDWPFHWAACKGCQRLYYW